MNTAQKISRNITGLLAFSLLLPNVILSCGWFENSETTRLAFFKPEIHGMAAMRPFFYSADLYNASSPDPERTDQYRNCLEWKERLGKDVMLEDIYFVLYTMPAELFEIHFEKNTLGEEFP